MSPVPSNGSGGGLIACTHSLSNDDLNANNFNRNNINRNNVFCSALINRTSSAIGQRRLTLS